MTVLKMRAPLGITSACGDCGRGVLAGAGLSVTVTGAAAPAPLGSTVPVAVAAAVVARGCASDGVVLRVSCGVLTVATGSGVGGGCTLCRLFIVPSGSSTQNCPLQMNGPSNPTNPVNALSLVWGVTCTVCVCVCVCVGAGKGEAWDTNCDWNGRSEMPVDGAVHEKKTKQNNEHEKNSGEKKEGGRETTNTAEHRGWPRSCAGARGWTRRAAQAPS